MKKQAQAAGNGAGAGEDPEDAAKVQAMLIQAETKAKIAANSAAARTQQKEVQFAMEERRKDLIRADISREGAKSRHELMRKRLHTIAGTEESTRSRSIRGSQNRAWNRKPPPPSRRTSTGSPGPKSPKGSTSASGNSIPVRSNFTDEHAQRTFPKLSGHAAEFKKVAGLEAFAVACDYAILELQSQMAPNIAAGSQADPLQGLDANAQMHGAAKAPETLLHLAELAEEKRALPQQELHDA